MNSDRSKTFLWGIMSLNMILTILCLIFVFLPHDEVVYADTQKIVREYKGMIEAKKNFDLKTSVWKTNLDSLRTETAQKIEEYEKQAPKLSTKERLLFEQLIQSKQEQLMNYQKVVEENIAREDQQFSEGVMNRINSYIKNFGDKRKYKVILGTSEYGNILYGKEDENITEEILKGLNEEFDKGL